MIFFIQPKVKTRTHLLRKLISTQAAPDTHTSRQPVMTIHGPDFCMGFGVHCVTYQNVMSHDGDLSLCYASEKFRFD